MGRFDLSATGQRIDADVSRLFASQVGKRGYHGSLAGTSSTPWVSSSSAQRA